MNVFVTGATGFLGKKVLEKLVDDERIKTIHVASRKKTSYPSEKVTVHQMDLTIPFKAAFLETVDTVIHLAGLYEFSRSFADNYKQNVLLTLNLTESLKELHRKEKPAVFYASTYAVGLKTGVALKEDLGTCLPPEEEPYAYTKAVAEKVLSSSGLPLRIFRFGILVGDATTGEIEKFDGPYALMAFLYRLKRFRLSEKLTRIQLPAVHNALLPLVPVDAAAEVIHRSLSLPLPHLDRPEFYGVFKKGSIQTGELVRAIFQEFLPSCSPVLLNQSTTELILKFQSYFTKIPKEVFYYTTDSIDFKNEKFISVFGPEAIPDFNSYRRTCFEGFRRCVSGMSSANA